MRDNLEQYIADGLFIAHDFDGQRRAKAEFTIISDKDGQAAYNKSIRDREVSRAVSRIRARGAA